MEILLSTNNQGKIDRFKKLLKHIDSGIKLHSPKELGIKVFQVEELGATLAENAELKARAYFAKTDMPILSNDTGFYVEGEGFVIAPKREALGEFGQKILTEKEIAEKLLNFWKGVASKHGGEVSAAWIESFAVIYPDGNIKRADCRREIILTNREFGKSHIHMPIRALYYSKTTNKPAIQHTEEEEILEMKPVIEALTEILKISKNGSWKKS